MNTFWSCYFIIDSNLSDDGRHVCSLIDVDFIRWGGTFTPIFKLTPSINTSIFPHYFAHFGKTLNISTANEPTFTVFSIFTE